ncbi:MAG: superoxide dismutase family protein [Clostridia bacterium]|nr:superoxide dismutase family protein [Clostridia bacterium]
MVSNSFCSVFSARPIATAFLKGSEKYPKIHGIVSFYNTVGGVIVRAEISGLPQNTDVCKNPIFAFHIHSGDTCQKNHNEPFASAGGHYNPDNCPHPYHSGDMLPLFGVKGKAFSAFLTDRFTIPEIINKTVIIHARPDDFKSQPAGNSGERIACGIITPTAR